MNIIPLVVGLLLIIAISTNALLKNKISDDLVGKSVSGYMAASRKALNNAESFYFNSLQEKPAAKTGSKTSQPARQNPPAQEKNRQINIQNAKINIYPLVMDKKENHPRLYDLTASLMRTLYRGKNFYRKNFEKEILNSVLSAFEIQLKKDKDPHLSNLFLKNTALQKDYYKILKGTKYYDFSKNIGTPSLLDYMKFEKSESKISMKDASYELLLTIFNRAAAQEIIVLQKENPPKNLTKETLLFICQKHHFTIDEQILDFFDFSNSAINSNEKTIVGIDKATNIKVKRKLNL